MSILVFIKTNLFPISVFSAIASFIVLTTISTIFSTDYNFISETISALGKSNRKHDWILMVTGITYSILIQGLIPLFYFSSKSMETKIINTSLILSYGITGIGTSIFKIGNYNYIVGAFTEDRVHEILARISFYSIWLLIALSPLTFKRIKQFTIAKTFSLMLTPIVFVAGMIFELNLHPEYRGLYQRFLFIIVMVWIILATKAAQEEFSKHFK
jgi:hypothetical protein